MKKLNSIIFAFILLFSCSEDKTTPTEDPIPDPVDPVVVEGKKIFKKNCSYCHHPTQKFACPPMKGVVQKRGDDWVINMITETDSMLKYDPIAIELLEEYGTIMPDLGISDEDANKILEYLKTI